MRNTKRWKRIQELAKELERSVQSRFPHLSVRSVTRVPTGSWYIEFDGSEELDDAVQALVDDRLLEIFERERLFLGVLVRPSAPAGAHAA